MNPDSPRVSHHPRVSLIMVKTLSTAVINGQEKPQKIPEKPNDEEEKKKELDPAALGPDGALQYYAKVGNLDLMRKAYEEGGKVNVPDRGPVSVAAETATEVNHSISGDYPLHMAVGEGHMTAVNELLNWEADIEAKNRIGSTALLRAVSHEQIEVAKRLLKDGASIETTNKIGNTALHCAAYVGSLEGAKLLIEAQALAHINQPNKYGATPLMLAAKSSSTLCKYLLSLRPGKFVSRQSTSPEYKEDKENKETTLSPPDKRKSIKTTNDTITEMVTEISSPSLPETRTIAAPSIAGTGDVELTSISESGNSDDR